jgi:hypothetical protein
LSEEDEAWLQALAGRSSGKTGNAAEEGQALRAALLARRIAVAGDPEQDAAREEQLLARARAAGLLAPRIAPRVKSRRTARRWEAWLAAAAFAAVVVGVSFEHKARREAPVLRGAGVTHLHAANPALLRETLLQELAAVGIAAHGYESLGRTGIDADVSLPVSPQVRALLDRRGIDVPANGVLQIEIEPDPP